MFKQNHNVTSIYGLQSSDRKPPITCDVPHMLLSNMIRFLRTYFELAHCILRAIGKTN